MKKKYHYTFRSEREANEYGRRLQHSYRIEPTGYLVASDAPESQWCTRRSFDVIEEQP